MKNFIIENSKYGKRLILCSKLTEEVVRYCIQNDIKELELNWAKGFKSDDLALLKDLSQLEAFDICDYTIKDISGIGSLRNLKELNISTYCKTQIDLSNFTQLESLSLFWRKNTIGFEKLKNLRKLFLYKYNPITKDLSELAALDSLEYLSLKSPSIESIGNVTSLKQNLKFLGIYAATKLQNIDSLAELTNLQTLELDTCKKINQLDAIGKMKSLEKLSISNCGSIESLEPVSKLMNLNELRFIESTNIIDGNINIVSSLPKLEKIVFQNRRHYNLKRA
ncbi:MAG: hypothetical protein A2Y12_14590 [Planctomycetes bacterium GWF2_42_9]|nr:MAG: hypothetical protein A2Y12_14590 [Planctomycetes bacterium GWF2_42_9]HAL45873.1 hypothetical protein [Phycisphaerales bacterium]